MAFRSAKSATDSTPPVAVRFNPADYLGEWYSDEVEGPGSLELVFSRDTKGKVTNLRASVSRALGVEYRRREKGEGRRL